MHGSENQTKICMLHGIAWELFDIVCCSIMHAHCFQRMTFKITSKVKEIRTPRELVCIFI